MIQFHEMDNFTKQISDLIPKNLDDIICKNRDQASISLSSKDEISQLEDTVELGLVKDLLDNWSLVSINLPTSGSCLVFLLGDRQNGEQRVTSAVITIDFNTSLVKTTSGSIYQLGEPLVGELSSHQLMSLCAMLHRSSVGEYLGVPHFFY